jgi:hypothetical protein
MLKAALEVYNFFWKNADHWLIDILPLVIFYAVVLWAMAGK